MKLIVGLGNPGKKYAGTRHNVGFDVVAGLAESYGDGSVKARFKGETVDARIHGEKVLLLCPHTYMNLSGDSVRAARDFYKIENAAILVICDDFNLDLGRLRFRPKGSAGGQKGLSDILKKLGDNEISRLRFGIGAAPDSWDVADYVLSKFTNSDNIELETATPRAIKAAATWVEHGTSHCMNEFNGAEKPRKKGG